MMTYERRQSHGHGSNRQRAPAQSYRVAALKTNHEITSLLLPRVIPFTGQLHGFSASPPSSAASASITRRGSSRTTTLTSTSIFDSNPLTSLFGNVASSISNIQKIGMPQQLSSDRHANLLVLTDQILTSHNIGSWEDIRNALRAKQTPEERKFRDNLTKGYGKASPLHKLRLFDESNKEDDVRVIFYRDSASWCPYCHKVWMALEEKRIPYRVEKINMRCYGDKPASFLRMQPSGSIPVAIIDGITYNQSNDIMYALEEQFPDHKPLVPYDPKQRMKAQELLRLERTLFSAWMGWLTSRDGPNGRLRDNFISVLNQVEAELSLNNGGFFLGANVSLVDFMFMPFLERMCASMLYFKGFQMRVAPGDATDYPALNRWFDVMETLESYQLTKSDYYTHCWDLPPQLGGCVPEAGSQPFQDAINGIEPGSWHLPLSPNNNGLEPDWVWTGDEDAAKREVVERISANHAALVSFASRGAGRSGFPRYGAPLADPNAMGNESVHPYVDALLKILAQKMLESNKSGSSVEKAMVELASVLKIEAGDELVENIALCLAYLRDRVGVPRDMRLPAARQLRAYLNWARDHILLMS